MVIFGDDIVTLFNRSWDDENEAEIWKAVVLKQCNLVATQGANISSSGLANADSAKLYVDPAEQALEYVKPKVYEELASKENVYTFTTQQDFFVLGDKSDIAPAEDGFFEYMLKHFDDVYRVTTVDEYTDVMKHFEIGGK